MEKGLPSRRFVCEHQVVPGLDIDRIKNMHKTKRQDIKVLYSFSNLEERCMYTVLESHDRLHVEAFFSDMRIPWDSILEVDVQGEGREEVKDLRGVRRAA
jgi:hypothetical protein